MFYSPDGFAKDPAVVRFKGKYFLYHSAYVKGEKPLRIAVAVSDDADSWIQAGLIPLDTECEKNGNGAPAAIVLDGRVHLFYQTYGNWARDAICHAVSEDGIRFEKDPTNPVFRPTGEPCPPAGSGSDAPAGWCSGRAIDADVVLFGRKLFLYFATRDHEMKRQMVGVASAPADSGFHREDFREELQAPVLEPVLPWEQECIEAPAAIEAGGRVWMFYGGAYNCKPQQIGLAVSDDGIRFSRVSDAPFMFNGAPGSWNASESGHPYVFRDDGGRILLFYQGSPDGGKTWILSRKELEFTGDGFRIIG
jgi:predicted GH43/DUF377 family glycosyl hydrolase